MNPSIQRLSRIPARLSDDLKIMRLVKNWGSLLKAKLDKTDFRRIDLRNGVRLESPVEMDLNFIFHEIWIEEIYTYPGYELKDGDVVIDIGGNIGVFATYAATRAPNVRVFAFEPFPKNAEYFLKNVEQSGLSGSVELRNVAVAGNNDPRKLRVANSWGCHSLADAEGSAGDIEVACTTLDQILNDTKRCDFLKIDCEGGEYEILLNAAPETLQRIHRVVMEYHDTENGSGNDLKGFFEKHRFRVDVFEKLDETTGVLSAMNLNYVR